MWKLAVGGIALLGLAGCGFVERGEGRVEAAQEEEHDEQAHDEHEEHEEAVALTAEQRAEYGVEVAEAGPGNLDTSLSLPGEVKLNEDRLAHIVPKLAGVVREIRKNLGDTVEPGEVMAVLDSRELASAKAAYLAARERVGLAQSTHDREKRLWEKKISAEQDYLEAKQGLAEAQIALRAAAQELHALGFTEDYLAKLPSQGNASLTRFEVVAPFKGVVIEKHVTLGEAVEPDAGIFTVADLDEVWADFSVHQRDLALAREGQVVRIGGDTEGVITYIGPMVSDETHTAVARAVLPNEERRWRPGQYVTGALAVESRPVAVRVPKTAIQNVEGAPSVFVETDEGFVAVAVELGASDNTYQEIMEGLEPGQRYAADGGFMLKAALAKGELGHHDH